MFNYTNYFYQVVGFHYLGPNAGEVTQGYAGMIKMGAKKADFDGLVRFVVIFFLFRKPNEH